MTVAELKSYIGGQLVAPVTLVQKIINCFLAVIDFITQSTTSGIPTWSGALTFNMDGTGGGAYCTFSDVNGVLRFWKSKTNLNTNNSPPSDPSVTFNTYWEEVSPASGSAIKEHAPGFFGSGLVIVMFNDGNTSGLYKLEEATRPFNSTNFLTELAAGKWSLFTPIVTKANLAAFPAAGAAGVLYIAGDSNLLYRWTGAAYVQTGGGSAPNLDAVLTTGNSAAGKRITNLLDPASAQDADTKAARDAAITALKDSVPSGGDTLNKLYNLIVSVGELVGGWSTAALPTSGSGSAGAIDKGDYWRITSTITIAGIGDLKAGDMLIAATAGASVAANFFAVQANVDLATSSVLGLVKLYTDLAAKNTDGSVTQSAAVNATQQPDAASATAAGTNTYTATIAPAITAYAANQRFYIKFTNGNTASATLNLNALGAKTIKKNSIDNLGVGDIVPGAVIELVYDGTNFQAIGLTKVLENAVGSLQQDLVTLSIYKESNFGTP